MLASRAFFAKFAFEFSFRWLTARLWKESRGSIARPLQVSKESTTLEWEIKIGIPIYWMIPMASRLLYMLIEALRIILMEEEELERNFSHIYTRQMKDFSNKGVNYCSSLRSFFHWPSPLEVDSSSTTVSPISSFAMLLAVISTSFPISALIRPSTLPQALPLIRPSSLPSNSPTSSWVWQKILSLFVTCVKFVVIEEGFHFLKVCGEKAFGVFVSS